jgi:hypothetical protein
MGVVDTQIFPDQRARESPFDPSSDIPATNTQTAIERVQTNLEAADAALKAPQYITAAASATLDNERVATNTASIEWDFATAGQAKANAVAASEILAGISERATSAEVIAGTDTDRHVTPAGLTAKVDTDGTLAGNLDTRIPSQKAVKTYADTKQPSDADLTTIAGLSPSNDDVIQRKAGAWANRTMVQLIADLAALGTTFQPLAAALTSWSAVTRASGFDAFAAAPSSANLRALLTDETGTDKALFTGGPGDTRGLYLKQDTGLDFAAAGEQVDFNALIVQNDEVDVEAGTGSKANGLLVYHGFGGGTGGRHALYGVLIQEAANDVGSVDRHYVGVQGQVQSATGDGGTDLAGGPTSKGAYFGGSTIAQLLSGATNTLNVTGFEFNTQIESGASTYYRSGIQVVDIGAVRGTVYDACYVIGAGGTATWRTGIAALSVHGIWPFDTDSTFIQTEGAHTMLAGLDFQGITFSDFILKSAQTEIREGEIEQRSVVGPGYRGYGQAGTLGSPSASQANDTLAFFGGHGYGASGFSVGSKATLFMKAAENWTDSAQGTYAEIETTPIGSTTRSAVMRWDSDGQPIFKPRSATPASLGTNGWWTLTPTSNTNFRISYRGSDGVTRVGNITLA